MKKLLTSIRQLNRLFWERVVKSTHTDTKSLSAFRVVAGLFLLIAYMPSFSWIANMPSTFFYPPVFSIANMFDTFPGRLFFCLIDGLVLISLICVTIGVKARVSALVYLIACLVGLSFQYSFGKISHTILSYVMMGCMAFSGWGRHLAVLPDKKSKYDNTAKSLSLFGVLLCFGMFTAGFEKALYWVDFDLQFNGFLGWSQNSIFKDYKYHLLAPYVKYFPSLFLELFDYIAVCFELSPLLFLLHARRSWKIWLLMACIFHLINALLLNVPYPRHIIVYLVFIDFRWLYQKLKHSLRLFYVKYIAASIVIIIISVRCIQLTSGKNMTAVYFDPDEAILLGLYLSIVAWCVAIMLFIRDIRQERP